MVIFYYHFNFIRNILFENLQSYQKMFLHTTSLSLEMCNMSTILSILFYMTIFHFNTFFFTSSIFSKRFSINILYFIRKYFFALGQLVRIYFVRSLFHHYYFSRNSSILALSPMYVFNFIKQSFY